MKSFKQRLTPKKNNKNNTQVSYRQYPGFPINQKPLNLESIFPMTQFHPLNQQAPIEEDEEMVELEMGISSLTLGTRAEKPKTSDPIIESMLNKKYDQIRKEKISQDFKLKEYLGIAILLKDVRASAILIDKGANIAKVDKELLNSKSPDFFQKVYQEYFCIFKGKKLESLKHLSELNAALNKALVYQEMNETVDLDSSKNYKLSLLIRVLQKKISNEESLHNFCIALKRHIKPIEIMDLLIQLATLNKKSLKNNQYLAVNAMLLVKALVLSDIHGEFVTKTDFSTKFKYFMSTYSFWLGKSPQHAIKQFNKLYLHQKKISKAQRNYSFLNEYTVKNIQTSKYDKSKINRILYYVINSSKRKTKKPALEFANEIKLLSAFLFGQIQTAQQLINKKNKHFYPSCLVNYFEALSQFVKESVLKANCLDDSKNIMRFFIMVLENLLDGSDKLLLKDHHFSQAIFSGLTSHAVTRVPVLDKYLQKNKTFQNLIHQMRLISRPEKAGQSMRDQWRNDVYCVPSLVSLKAFFDRTKDPINNCKEACEDSNGADLDSLEFLIDQIRLEGNQTAKFQDKTHFYNIFYSPNFSSLIPLCEYYHQHRWDDDEELKQSYRLFPPELDIRTAPSDLLKLYLQAIPDGGVMQFKLDGDLLTSRNEGFNSKIIQAFKTRDVEGVEMSKEDQEVLELLLERMFSQSIHSSKNFKTKNSHQEVLFHNTSSDLKMTSGSYVQPRMTLTPLSKERGTSISSRKLPKIKKAQRLRAFNLTHKTNFSEIHAHLNSIDSRKLLCFKYHGQLYNGIDPGFRRKMLSIFNDIHEIERQKPNFSEENSQYKACCKKLKELVPRKKRKERRKKLQKGK